MNVGTAEAVPGSIERGYLSITDLPTGTPERIPVIVGDGADDGPTLWVTASIHGDEVTGLAVAQDVLDEDVVSRLRGTVVCLPNLNPSGLRRTERTSAYDGDDPNRCFPNGGRVRPPRTQELIDARLFEEITASASALVSLHTSWVGSIQFSIRNRVPFGDDRDRTEAVELSSRIDHIVSAFGLPVVNQFPPAEYADRGLRRGITGALVETRGIPAFTAELGGRFVVEERSRRLGVTGVRNVMRELDMLPEAPVPNAEAPVAPVDYPVRRYDGPCTAAAGVVRHRVRPGARVEPDETVADVLAPNGEHLGTVDSDREGYVLSRREGVAVYESDPVLSMAVRDDRPLVVPDETTNGTV